MHYISFSKRLAARLNKFGIFDAEVRYFLPALRFLIKPWEVKGVVTWKYKTALSENFARKHGLDCIYLEEAFISSLVNRYGISTEIGLYIEKNGGQYYKYGDKPHALKLLLEKGWKIPKNEVAKNRLCISLLKENCITKYNNFTAKSSCFLPEGGAAKILVIDQVKDDLSITANGNGGDDFRHMYEAALKLAGGRKIYVKMHPKKAGYMKEIADPSKCILVPGSVNLHSMLPFFQDVFTVSSQAGFDALLFGKKVHVFGKPFYCGWGLTIDYNGLPSRGVKRKVEELFFAYYQVSCRYFIEGSELPLIEILRLIIENKARFLADEQTRFFVWKVPLWKRKRFYDYIYSKNIHFVHTLAKIKEIGFKSGDRVVIWGKPYEEVDLRHFSLRNKLFLTTCEDGFVRSNGLGSNFAYPLSLTFDKTGIYFDSRHESDMEILLNTYDLSDEERARGADLRRLLLLHNTTKFSSSLDSVKKTIADIKKQAGKREIALITGQVSDDKSILCGSVDIDNYLDAIKQVRADFPEAFIIYKPHPDVVESNRKGFISQTLISKYVDLIFTSNAIAQLFEIVDSIHTITSLSGFEGLVRGKKVYTYGLPFYAGWGLAIDRNPTKRRVRKRDLEELIFLALAKYPMYFLPESSLFATPEIVITKIAKQKSEKRRTYIVRRASQFFNLFALFMHSAKSTILARLNEKSP